MLKEKIYNYFEKYPDLKILFFFDANQEYKSEIDQIELDNIHKLYWEDNPFTIKVKLTEELKNEKTFLYLPIKHPNNHESYLNFPLLGLLIANKELQLDDIGGLMEKFAIPRHQKSLLNKYITELKYNTTQDVCAPILSSNNLNEEILQQAIISSILKFSSNQPWSVILFKLSQYSYLKNEDEYIKIEKKLKSNNLAEIIIEKAKKTLGLNLSSIDLNDLKKIGLSIRYNQITQTIDEVNSIDPYTELKIQDQNQLVLLNQLMFVIDQNRYYKQDYNDLCNKIDNEIKGNVLLDLYGYETDFGEYSRSMVWAIINKSIEYIFENTDVSQKLLERLSVQNNIDETTKTLINSLIQCCKFSKVVNNNKSSLIKDTPKQYIQWYEAEGFLIDQYYRRFIHRIKSLDVAEIPDQINIEDILGQINDLYDDFTAKLNREWLKCLNEFQFDYSKINHPKQFDFYESEVNNVDQKMVVLISDALRYESGIELLSEMHGDPKNTAEIKSMLASIPSKTNVGMSNLLPGKKYDYNGGDVLIDGNKTDGINSRSQLLQNHNSDAIAVQYSEIISLNREDIRELFKKPVVYVYHDVIDSTGDKKPSERRAFSAVSEAIDELKKFIKSLHATYNVAKVIITADHGFLYNDKEIEDKNKQSVKGVDEIKYNNRYIITDKEFDPELGYCVSFNKTSKFNDDLYITIPNSTNRYKKQGVGHQFVHGGGAIQELLVPVIESSRKRIEVAKKVTPQLMGNQSLRVVSNILRLNLLQKEQVGRNQKELTLSVGLYNDRTLVSNEDIKTMNFTSDSPSERILRVELVLNTDGAKESFLKLKVFDVDDKLNPLIEERVQNNTLIEADF